MSIVPNDIVIIPDDVISLKIPSFTNKLTPEVTNIANPLNRRSNPNIYEINLWFSLDIT